jgi:hypothetical protein
MLDAKAQLDRVKEILYDSAKVLLTCNPDDKKAKFCEMLLLLLLLLLLPLPCTV